jgi:hypothetical protein
LLNESVGVQQQALAALEPATPLVGTG